MNTDALKHSQATRHPAQRAARSWSSGQLGDKILSGFGWNALLGLSMVVLLQACASLSAARHDYRAGWREAVVIRERVDSAPIAWLERDCREGAQTHGIQNRYAVLSYLNDAHHRASYIAAVPADLEPAAGQVYRVNVKDCRAPWQRTAR